MSLLDGSPYLLDEVSGPQIVRAATELADQVGLLRSSGKLAPETLRKLRDEWGVVQVYESAGIEGNTLDLSETQMAIQKGITISGKPTEHSDEVRNLHSALEFLEQLAQSQDPLTEREIREVHALVVGSADARRGNYRSSDVEITNSPHKPPSHLLVAEQMEHFVGWVAARRHELPTPLLAAVCHAWFVHIHPFHDGNGRTARAITNLMLMRSGFPVVVVRRKDRQRYYEALRASDDGDIGPFMELIVDRARDSLGQIDRVNRAAGALPLALQRLRAAEERRYRVWADGIRLLATSLEDAIKGMEEAGVGFQAKAQHYGLPSFEDCQMLSERDAAGATWLERYDLERRGVRHSVLLWIGYSSNEMISGLRAAAPFPTVWVSMENPARSPRWVPADASFPRTSREIAFHEGKFVSRMQDGSIRRHDTVLALTAEFVAALVDGWFV